MSEISDTKQLSHAELRKAYEANENILRVCKEKLGSHSTNEQAAIMHSYELQAGSYIRRVTEDSEQKAKIMRYGRAIAEVLEIYSPASILEAGVGEATTLVEVVKSLPPKMGKSIYAFDLSWSRVLLGRRYFEKETSGQEDQGKRDSHFFAGELEHIALPDNSFDVVFTSHAIEPNHGREQEILQELYRVTAGHLVLFEPAYELASKAARERMEYHGYCRGLKEIALANGWTVSRSELFEAREDAANPTMVLIIDKGLKPASEKQYVSPFGGGPLVLHNGHYFNHEEGLVFPVLGEVPYLTRSSGILASHYLQS
jgi:SAM-dependent methyltransferase